LNEELGQVEYVFSDKTGTLTCNVMEFKKFSAGTKSYGTGQKPTAPQESNVCFHDPAVLQDLKDARSASHEALHRAMIFLACCHTIVIDERKGTYNAASPDELALVNAAKQFGYEFKGVDDAGNLLIYDMIEDKTLKYRLMNICEFDSTRKRMSVIVKDPQGRLILMCKGADSVILERLSQASREGEVLSKTQEYVDLYAEEGLRTLFLAEKIIDEATYEEWNAEAEAAKLEIHNRDEAVAAVDEKIETDLELIGSTAIEDRL
jgi:phospholipid-transporting ATPase